MFFSGFKMSITGQQSAFLPVPDIDVGDFSTVSVSKSGHQQSSSSVSAIGPSSTPHARAILVDEFRGQRCAANNGALYKNYKHYGKSIRWQCAKSQIGKRCKGTLTTSGAPFFFG